MALIPRLTNLFNDIRRKIEPHQLEVSEAHYLTRRQFFSGLDEFNPTKMDSDDDIVDMGIEAIENREESSAEAELNYHRTTTQKVLNYLA